MNVREVIVSIRDDYVEQFNQYVEAHRAVDPAVFVERRIAAPESKLFARAYVPDVSFGDPVERMSDLLPRPRAGKIPQFELESPKIHVRFDDLWWDDVRIDHDGSFTGELVSWWFNRWFPPLGPHAPRADGVSGFIHSVTVDEQSVNVDLGSAGVSALFDILSVAQRCGAKTARVTSTRAPA
jgi:hypothetical protein